MIEKWNKHEKIGLMNQQRIRILIPTVKRYQPPNGEPQKVGKIGFREWVLVEDYLPGEFIKWNSNSGWFPGRKLKNNLSKSARKKIILDQNSPIQAFCHWTYHASNGQILFCDAQGIKTKKEYILTDPCILSVQGYRYGAADGGFDFILNWFKHHTCNKYCKKYWIKPHGIMSQQINVTQNTTWTWDTEEYKKKKQEEKRKQCKCGNLLKLMFAIDIDPETQEIACRECQKKMTQDRGVYHCPSGKNNKHPGGLPYNICRDCFKAGTHQG